MGFGVVFGLLMAVSGWWLYSRWAALRDSQAQRREAEMMMVYEATSARPRGAAGRSESMATVPAASEFRETLPGARR